MEMAKHTRMSNEDRRQVILKAARELFARTGLEGARTAELARAAGVSERLLYKHFPSKEALHKAALTSLTDEIIAEARQVIALESSTSTLVLLTHFLVSQLLSHSPERDAFMRLAVRSMAGDGEFARFGRKQMVVIEAKLQKCLEKAIVSGDIAKGIPAPKTSTLFLEALATGVAFGLLPTPATVDYGVPGEKIIEQVVWFALRGMGLRDDVIRRHYNAKAIALLAG
jgi:AcrR family transcriptional regulator